MTNFFRGGGNSGSSLRLLLVRLGLAGACLGLASPPVGGADFQLALNAGWNFVSLPLTPADASVAGVFQGRNAGGVWGWMSGSFRTVEQIEPGLCYWVYCTPAGAGTVTIGGTALDSSVVQLTTGWNAVGPRPDYMRPSHPKILGPAWGWSAEQQQYQAVTGGALAPGQGYWLYASSDLAINFRAHFLSGVTTGDRVAGVRVLLSGRPDVETFSGNDGAFSIGNLGSGVYQVTPSAEGFAFQPTSLEVELSGADVGGLVFVSRDITRTAMAIEPALGIAASTEDGHVAVTVPVNALTSAGESVPASLRSLSQPAVPVAASATVITATAQLELPGEAVAGEGAGTAAYAFEMVLLPAADGTDARYRLGCVRIGFQDEETPTNLYSEDVYGVSTTGTLAGAASAVVQVPASEMARVRQAADAALGPGRLAGGHVMARFEAAVVDLRRYFGNVGTQAATAGATVYQRASSALDRPVELFMLRWNPETRVFDSSDAPSLEGKRVVVLLHGWPQLAGFGSDQGLLEPHRSTWQALMEYATGAAQGGPDLRQSFEFYTVRYDSDQRVYDNAAVIWQALAVKFADHRVTLLAHASGGLIAHAMEQRYHPNGVAIASWPNGGLERVVTLNAPLHGTPLVQLLRPGGLAAPQAAAVVGAPLAFLACGTPGTLDLGWDGFNTSANPITQWTSTDLLALNALTPLAPAATYVTYATAPFPASRGADDGALVASGAQLLAVFGQDYANDSAVPVKSARLYRFVNGEYVSQTVEHGTGLSGYNHLQIYEGKASGDVNADHYDETLFSAVLADVSAAVPDNPHVRTISGTISGDIRAGVTVTLSGQVAMQTVSGNDGAFLFEQLGSGIYRVTPSAAGMTFAPTTVRLLVEGADVTGLAFTGQFPSTPVEPAVGATLSTDDLLRVSATVPAGALSAAGAVPVALRSLARPSEAVAASATVRSATAQLLLPAEAIPAQGAAALAYAFELAILPTTSGTPDDRYWAGCVRLGFYDKDDVNNAYYEDVYGAVQAGTLNGATSGILRVPTMEISRVRTAADTALGAGRIASGRVRARFEAVVFDMVGYFGKVQGQADAAGASVYLTASSALTRNVDVFLLHWNPATHTFDNSEPASLTGKKVVVLLHGWQTLAGFGSDQGLLEPHRTTWQPLLEYATGMAQGTFDLGGTFEFYTVRYDGDQRIYDNALTVWQALATKFPGRKVTVLAHGAGGVIAHAMMQQYHPGGVPYANWSGGGVERLVALNAPFHGTPLVQLLRPGGVVAPQPAAAVSAALAFLACGTPGALDAAWDGFDGGAPALWINTDLLALNASGAQNLATAYFTFATGLFGSRGATDAALAASGAQMRAVFGAGANDDNDGVVPVKSARLYRYAAGSYASRTAEQGAGLSGYNHLQVFTGKSAGDLNGDHYDEALFMPIMNSLVPQIAGMGFIPGGAFQMGDAMGDGLPAGTPVAGEGPVHMISVNPFYIGEVEITNEQMRQVMQWAYTRSPSRLTVTLATTSTPTTVKNKTGQAQLLLSLSSGMSLVFDRVGNAFIVTPGEENYPCVGVTWYGAAAYANFRSEMEGRQPCFNFTNWTCDFTKTGYRLPTEAQWEKAARGGATGQRFPWGDTITQLQANYTSSAAYSYDVSPTHGVHPVYLGNTAPVDAFGANAYGLHNMSGNVLEWCFDWYSSNWYQQAGATVGNTTGPATGSGRVIRGGSASALDVEAAKNCRNSARGGNSPSAPNSMLGFRVALPF